jgi:hypothetical protein
MQTGRLNVRITADGKPTHVRVQLTVPDGTVKYPPGCLAYDRDRHFTAEGGFSVELPEGRSILTLEKGKEYLQVRDEVEIVEGSDVTREYKMTRWIEMNSLGWYSGDTHVHRMPENIEHLMEAEDLNFAPVLSTWNQKDVFERSGVKRIVEFGNRAYSLVNQEDERSGGAIMALDLERPVRVETGSWYPSEAYFGRRWREGGAIIEQEKPFWWEAPVNVALGLVDTVGIVNNHLQRAEVMENEAWGRPRDMEKYPGALGFVHNVLDLYYRYLNLGIKLPITSGSASGVLRNPLGYNRLYVRLDEGFSYKAWLDGMRAGRAFATNGPMLFFTVDGEMPGLTAFYDGTCEVGLEVRTECPRRLRGIEILRNGETVFTGEEEGEMACLRMKVEGSCWVAARVFEDCDETVRLAHSNPVFIEAPGPVRPSREDALYYMEWCQELLEASRNDPERYGSEVNRREVEGDYEQAIKFYRELAC